MAGAFAPVSYASNYRFEAAADLHQKQELGGRMLPHCQPRHRAAVGNQKLWACVSMEIGPCEDQSNAGGCILPFSLF